MKNKVNYQEAQDLILSNAACVGTERISLENSFRRILAEDLIAAENVPARPAEKTKKSIWERLLAVF